MHSSAPPSLLPTSGFLCQCSPFSITSAIATQDVSIQHANNDFIANERPHILLLNPQGYAGPEFPFSARDTGGQTEYVNYEAMALADLGYKVTVATRAFKPERKYASYGDRKGVEFMEGTNNAVRYIYVPGMLGFDAPFLRKEKIYEDLPPMTVSLWCYLCDEANFLGLKPWDVSNILFINSHYVDGGIMGQLLVRFWQGQRAAEHLREYSAPILKDAKFDPVALLDNLNLNFGAAVIDAYNRANGNGPSKKAADRAQVLKWAADRLGWDEATTEQLIVKLHKKPGKNRSFAPDAMDASSIGRRLLVAEKGIQKSLKKQLRALNRHAWTPHSIGELKERRAISSGEAWVKPEKHMDMNYFIRGMFEAGLLRGKSNPLGHLPPPARLVVETSQEIGEATFWEGRTEKNRSLQFLPGIDPDIFFPRSSVDDQDVQGMFKDLASRGVVPGPAIKALLDTPHNHNIVIEASRIDDTKRKDWVIEAYRMLPEAIRRSTFVFITGERNDETKDIYDPLIAKISELGVGDHVFLAGRVPPEHIGAFSCLPHCKGPRTFRHAQYITTSRMEGWGMAAQNSVAGGLALIASKHTPIAGYLRYKDNAAVVVSDDTQESFAKAMQSLIEQPEFAQAMAERGRAIAKHHTWDVLTKKFVDGVLARLKLSDVTNEE